MQYLIHEARGARIALHIPNLTTALTKWTSPDDSMLKNKRKSERSRRLNRNEIRKLQLYASDTKRYSQAVC